jgi:hypothetical protein
LLLEKDADNWPNTFSMLAAWTKAAGIGNASSVIPAKE